jgi:hypothetical protein
LDAALARRIGRATARAHLSGDAADVDDLTLSSIMFASEAAGLDPISADGLGGEEQALQIQIEHSVPILANEELGAKLRATVKPVSRDCPSTTAGQNLST